MEGGRRECNAQKRKKEKELEGREEKKVNGEKKSESRTLKKEIEKKSW